MTQEVLVRIVPGQESDPAFHNKCVLQIVNKLQKLGVTVTGVFYRQKGEQGWSRGSHTYLTTVENVALLETTLQGMVKSEGGTGYQQERGKPRTMDWGGGTSLSHRPLETKVEMPIAKLTGAEPFDGEIRGTSDNPDLIIEVTTINPPPRRRQ